MKAVSFVLVALCSFLVTQAHAKAALVDISSLPFHITYSSRELCGPEIYDYGCSFGGFEYTATTVHVAKPAVIKHKTSQGVSQTLRCDFSLKSPRPVRAAQLFGDLPASFLSRSRTYDPSDLRGVKHFPAPVSFVVRPQYQLLPVSTQELTHEVTRHCDSEPNWDGVRTCGPLLDVKRLTLTLDLPEVEAKIVIQCHAQVPAEQGEAELGDLELQAFSQLFKITPP